MKNHGIQIKSSDDIKRIHDACRIIVGIFKAIGKMSLEGMSTWELDTYIDNAIVKKKARAAFKTVIGYSHASCISINNEVVHGIPRKKKIIKNGDIVKVDIGVVLNGYFGDACYTFEVGEISDIARKLILVTRESLEKAIRIMIPGNKLGDIGYTIQNHVEKNGFSVVRTFTGHGIGFDLHEPPVIPHYGKKGTGIPLKEGMVLAVEPMINEGEYRVQILEDGWTAVTSDDTLSVQFEHTVAITKDGPKILTL